MGLNRYDPNAVAGEPRGRRFTVILFGGLLIAFLAAVAWAVICVVFDLPPALASIAVGFVEGRTIRTMAQSSALRFGILAALLALVASLLGNLFVLSALGSPLLGMSAVEAFWLFIAKPEVWLHLTGGPGVLEVLTFGAGVLLAYQTAIARSRPTDGTELPPRVRGAG
jgi:hypothetical protein